MRAPSGQKHDRGVNRERQKEKSGWTGSCCWSNLGPCRCALGRQCRAHERFCRVGWDGATHNNVFVTNDGALQCTTVHQSLRPGGKGGRGGREPTGRDGAAWDRRAKWGGAAHDSVTKNSRFSGCSNKNEVWGGARGRLPRTNAWRWLRRPQHTHTNLRAPIPGETNGWKAPVGCAERIT